MGVEFELKYSALPEQLAAIAQRYPLSYRTIEMETTYFDTHDGKLSQRHITLRCRMENDRAVCTVKTPLEGIGRGEWECECTSIEEAIPKLCLLGATRELLVLTAEGVQPVCGAKLTRRCGELVCDCTRLELALDQGVLIGGGKRVALCEVEVELKSGTPEETMKFAEALAREFGLQPQHKSKFRRALGLVKGE